MKTRVVILGAGVTGLTAGYFLSRSDAYEVTVLEKQDDVGGVCASFEHNGCVLDYGAHKIYSVIPGLLDEMKAVMGNRLLELPKRNRLFLLGRLLDYPLRIGGLLRCLSLSQILRLGFGLIGTVVKGIVTRERLSSYEAYVVRRFGRTAYQMVFEPLADKTWGDPATLHYDIARTRIPSSGALELALKLIGLKKETQDTNAETFFYPRGGYGNFPQALRQGIEARGGRIVTGARLAAVETEQGRAVRVAAEVGGTDQWWNCDVLISSIPMAEMVAALQPAQDEAVRQDLARMQYRHLILVYLWVARDRVLEDQWIFFPEREHVFSRIFEQKQMDPSLVPEGQSVICCDLTADPESVLWKTDDRELARRCIEDLARTGLMSAGEVTDVMVKRVMNFYPRYDLDYQKRMDRIAGWFDTVPNLIPAGRLGMYNYNNADHCFDLGRLISLKLQEGVSPLEIAALLRDRITTYKIVD